jgi:hypothetical protein
MRTKYKNILYHIISEYNLEPSDFELTETIENEMPSIVLSYKKTPFSFIIRNSKESYELFDYQFIQYGPDFKMTPIYPDTEFTDFETVANEFDEWLNEHIIKFIEDQNDIDLWSQIEHRSNELDINNIDFDNKNKFLNDEKKQIRLAINELKLLINRNFEINESEQKLVNDRLDYLIDATERLNKYDWKSLIISTLISISIALSFDTEKGKMLFELFRKVFLNIQNIGH